MLLTLLSIALLLMSAEVALITQGFRFQPSSHVSKIRSSRRWSGSSGGEAPQRPSRSRRDELKSALQYARKYDSDWLQTVFGDKLPTFLEEAESEVEAEGETKTTEVLSDEEDPVPTSSSPSEINISVDQEEFVRLGYSKSEVSMIKPSVRAIIIERSVAKPRRGIPDEWLADGGRPAASFDRGTDEPPSFTSRRGMDRSGERTSRARRSDTESRNGLSDIARGGRQSEGEAFSWNGKPPTVVEIENSIDFPGDDADYVFSSQSDAEEEGLSFWPDKEEFKNMLIEESKARIEVTGDWIKPLVKQEAKWRYGLYKGFLKFAGEGLDDRYDIEPLDQRQGKATSSSSVRRDGDQDNARKYNKWFEDRVERSDGWTDAEELPFDNYQEQRDSPVNKDEWFSDQETTTAEKDRNWNVSLFDTDESSFDLISRARNEVSEFLDDTIKNSQRSKVAYRDGFEPKSKNTRPSFNSEESTRSTNRQKKSELFERETDEY